MARWCVGIDLGGTFVKFGLLSEDRQAGPTFQLPTLVDARPGGVIARMAEGARQLIEGRGGEEFVAVGVGAPGPLNIAEGVVVAMPNIPGMENVPLAARLSEALGLPVFLENDANAAAYGEFLCGSGAGCRSMVLLTLGTGVGSGIIIDGQILHGSHDIGAEIGHMIVIPDGEPCACGQRGCLERYSSATYMAQRATRMVRQGRASRLKAVLERKGSLDSLDVEQARKAGDGLAAEVWDDAARCLAVACVNICRVLDCDQIVLAGGLAKAGDELMVPLMAHFRRLHWSLTAPRTKIVFASLGNDAGVIGAAAVAWRGSG